MSHSGDAPQLAAPKPVLMSADLSGLLTHKQPPPLPSPSLKPRKLSNPPAAAQVSPASRRRKMSKAQQRQELMEGTGSSTNNIGFDDDDDDDDFGEVSPRARIVSQRRDSDVVPSKSRSPSRQLDAARPRASPETRRAPATQPFDHAAPCADGATGPYEVPVTDEQVWREFVIEENYSVLATKGILQRIADFNHSHKAIQILKMQNAALAEVDRQNDEIHGMDLVEKEKEKERMNIKKKKSIRRVGSKKGSSGDTESTSNEADDEFSTVGADGSSSEPNSAVGSGGGGAGSGSGGRRKRNGKSGKAKDLFKSDFIIKMKLQMKKHLNELCKRDYPRVRFSGRCHVNFLHGELLQRKKEYVSEITLQNIGVRTARIKMQQFGTSPRDSVFDLVAEPNEFEIPKGKKQVVTFKLTVHSSKAIVSEVIGVEIGWRENSKEAKTKDKSNLRFPRRLCIYVSGLGEAAVFGVPLSQVEMVPWEAAGKSHRSGLVPKVLVDLRENLIRTGGLQQEGIFRKAPSDVETQQVRVMFLFLSFFA